MKTLPLPVLPAKKSFQTSEKVGGAVAATNATAKKRFIELKLSFSGNTGGGARKPRFYGLKRLFSRYRQNPLSGNTGHFRAFSEIPRHQKKGLKSTKNEASHQLYSGEKIK